MVFLCLSCQEVLLLQERAVRITALFEKTKVIKLNQNDAMFQGVAWKTGFIVSI